MVNNLLKTAYDELEKLKKEKPSWEVYNRLNILNGAIQYLQKFVKGGKKISTIDDAIDNMVEKVGEKATIEFVKMLLNDIKQDMDFLAPIIGESIMKKISRGVNEDVE